MVRLVLIFRKLNQKVKKLSIDYNNKIEFISFTIQSINGFSYLISTNQAKILSIEVDKICSELKKFKELLGFH